MILPKNSILSIGIFIITVTFIYPTAMALDNDSSLTELSFNFSERFRIETWDNTTTLSAGLNGGTAYARFRTGAMMQYTPNGDLEFCFKITNEFRKYFSPSIVKISFDEIFIDQLYFKYNLKSILPATITIGRQNMMMGEGFVIMDGGPLDGSRSGYFNAVRADLKLAGNKSLTLLYCRQERQDYMLPVIENKHKSLNDQNENAFGAYFSSKIEGFDIQNYFLSKFSESTFYRDFESDIHMLGVRVQKPIGHSLTLTAEDAVQFGSRDTANVLAFGGYAYLKFNTSRSSPYPSSMTAGAIYLSGDDLSSSKYEGWDPFYGRWPKWSESYIYTLANEYGPAYWTNLASIYAKIQFIFHKNMFLTMDHHHMMAPLKMPSVGGYPWGNGHHRGNLSIVKITFNLTKSLSGHALWENFIPGSFYYNDADVSNWLRIEFMLTL